MKGLVVQGYCNKSELPVTQSSHSAALRGEEYDSLVTAYQLGFEVRL